MTPSNVPRDSKASSLPATVERATAIPMVIAAGGEKASERFFTFFTDNIRNKNTRPPTTGMRVGSSAGARTEGLLSGTSGVTTSQPTWRNSGKRTKPPP